jgi:hypothetical protein
MAWASMAAFSLSESFPLVAPWRLEDAAHFWQS